MTSSTGREEDKARKGKVIVPISAELRRAQGVKVGAGISTIKSIMYGHIKYNDKWI